MTLLLYFLNELNGSGINQIQSIRLLHTCISGSKYYYNDIDVILDEVFQLFDYLMQMLWRQLALSSFPGNTGGKIE